jgi:hypothetical protein
MEQAISIDEDDGHNGQQYCRLEVYLELRNLKNLMRGATKQGTQRLKV